MEITKQYLDSLSEPEIRDIRISLIHKKDFRLVDEIGLYLDIRYKENHFDRYAEWKRKSLITTKCEDNKDFYYDEITKRPFDETEMKTFKLLTEVVDRFGYEKYYKLIIDGDKLKLGESQYNLY